jgi:hypothetical protein
LLKGSRDFIRLLWHFFFWSRYEDGKGKFASGHTFGAGIVAG